MLAQMHSISFFWPENHMNGKWAWITDLIDGDRNRLDAAAVILPAQGLNVNAARVFSAQGGERGEKRFWTGSMSFPPRATIRSKLLWVSCAELTPSHPQPVLQVLQPLAAPPHDFTSLSFLSPNILLLACLPTAVLFFDTSQGHLGT